MSILFFCLAITAYTITQLIIHGKLKWADRGFWSVNGDWKYEWMTIQRQKVKVAAPNNWYYRLTKVKYKERFPGSATIFVFVTDGYHLLQFFFKAFIVAAIVTYTRYFGYYDAIIYFVIFGIHFTIRYRALSK